MQATKLNSELLNFPRLNLKKCFWFKKIFKTYKKSVISRKI